MTFRTRALLNSDPFLDRTLLYSQDGERHKVQLTDEEIELVLSARKAGTVVSKKPQLTQS